MYFHGNQRVPYLPSHQILSKCVTSVSGTCCSNGRSKSPPWICEDVLIRVVESMDWFKEKLTGNHGFYWFLPSNIGVSCKLSHHPILWLNRWTTPIMKPKKIHLWTVKWPWLSVITGYFYGIMYSINGVISVLITGILGHNWIHTYTILYIMCFMCGIFTYKTGWFCSGKCW